MATQTSGGLKGWHVGAGLLGAFAVVLSVNITFVWFALSSFPGEDVPRAYLQGLDYNRTLTERAEARALGWRTVAGLEAGDAGARVLAVTMTDAQGGPLDGLELTVLLRHRADAARDRQLTVTAEGGGRYFASLADVPPGTWQAVIRAQDAQGHRLEARKDLWWE